MPPKTSKVAKQLKKLVPCTWSHPPFGYLLKKRETKNLLNDYLVLEKIAMISVVVPNHKGNPLLIMHSSKLKLTSINWKVAVKKRSWFQATVLWHGFPLGFNSSSGQQLTPMITWTKPILDSSIIGPAKEIKTRANSDEMGRAGKMWSFLIHSADADSLSQLLRNFSRLIIYYQFNSIHFPMWRLESRQ